MATGFFATNDEIKRLTDSLKQIEAAGLPKPENCLLSDYLQFLVDHQILLPQTAPYVEQICYASRYGGNFGDTEILGKTLTEVEAAISRLREFGSDKIEHLAVELSKTFAVPLQLTTEDQTAAVTSQSTLSPSRDVGFGSDPTFDEPPQQFVGSLQRSVQQTHRFRVWSRILVALLLWTCVVITVGYLTHAQIQKGIAFLKDQPIPQVKSHDQRKLRNAKQHQLNNKRAIIMASNPEGLRVSKMKELAGEHLMRGEYAETFFIYEYLINREADDPDLKNSLAWFLLTARNGWYRDPIRALQLAEEAVQADPKPIYLDTLAEACFQNKDYQRAVELEKRAVGENREAKNVPFLEKQLLKFREAAEKQTTEVAEQDLPTAN